MAGVWAFVGYVGGASHMLLLVHLLCARCCMCIFGCMSCSPVCFFGQVGALVMPVSFALVYVLFFFV